MPANSAFRDLITRVRRGDEAAAAEVVRLYEPEIRRAIRLRFTDQQLRRQIDSMDVCQSVLANFFVRAAAGQFELEDPGQLLKLLVTMARNRLLDHARRQQAERRSKRRTAEAGQEIVQEVAARQHTPSQEVELKELLQKLRENLTEDERLLADERAAGRDWAVIAADRGETPDAVRKRLARAIDRVAPRLGLEAPGNDEANPPPAP